MRAWRKGGRELKALYKGFLFFSGDPRHLAVFLSAAQPTDQGTESVLLLLLLLVVVVGTHFIYTEVQFFGV